MKKIMVVDLVRTIGVLAVMGGHLGIIYLPKPSGSILLESVWYKLWMGGSYGVSMFFVVSGYLITRLIAQSEGGLFRPDFKDFYARRVGRIIPLLALIVLYGFILISFFPSTSPAFQYCFKPTGYRFSWGFWASLASFSNNWYQLFSQVHGLHWIVLWSLSIEEQFYFFYPLCLKWLGNGRRLWPFLLFFILLGPASRWLIFKLFPGSVLVQAQFNSFSGFGLIATGCLLYFVEERTQLYLGKHPRLCRQLTALGFLIVCRVYLKRHFFADFWGQVLDHSFIGMGLFLFLLGAFHLNLSRWKPLLWMSLPGRLSYGMYLFQSTVMFLLWDLLRVQSEFPAYLIYILATGTLAYLSHRIYEWPVNLYLRRKLGNPVKVTVGKRRRSPVEG